MTTHTGVRVFLANPGDGGTDNPYVVQSVSPGLSGPTTSTRRTVEKTDPAASRTADGANSAETAPRSVGGAVDEAAGRPTRQATGETARHARRKAMADERRRAVALAGTGGTTPTSLHTEVLGDGDANCLEKAVTGAKDHHELVFMDDQRTASGGNANRAGHVLIRDPASGRVWDPNAGAPPGNPQAWPHRSAEAWAAEQGFTADGKPAYTPAGAANAGDVRSVLSLPPHERAAAIAKNPALQNVEHRVVADDDQDPGVPGAAGLGLAFPKVANVTGTHGTAPETALKILETMADGKPPFKPDLGLGGVQWFVTDGNPHVGPTSGKGAVIPVDIDVPKGSLEFREADLNRIFDAELPAAQKLAEEQLRQRQGLKPTDALNSRQRSTIRHNANKIAERAMWKKVGEQVADSRTGVGRVVLENSKFSRSGNGTFTLTSRPQAVRIQGGAKGLVDVIKKTGQKVEGPLLERAKKLAGNSKFQGAFKVGGRVLVIAGAAMDGYRILTAEDKPREAVKVAGGWGGAAAASSAAGSWASPMLAGGPWGWAGYGLVTIGAGAVGYFVGESVAEEAYELVIDGDPMYFGPADK